MSLSWRERLRRMSKEQLNLTQEEFDKLWENIADFCEASDKKIHETVGDDVDVDKCIDNMDEESFRQMTQEIVDETLLALGIRKKKKRDSDKDEAEEVVNEELPPEQQSEYDAQEQMEAPQQESC